MRERSKSGPPAKPPIVRPPCPRCDYDLSGQIAVWTGPDSVSCPLTGTCSECGLEFAWLDVFSPRFADSRLIECDRRFAKSFRHTLALTRAPWRLWREVRMEQPARWMRLGLYVLLCVATIY